METPKETKQPTEGSPFDGDTDQVRAGLYAALVEALCRFLVSLPQTAVDMKAVRRANRYMLKDAIKANILRQMARITDTKPRKVQPFDLLSCGVASVRGLVVNGQVRTVDTMSGLMADAFTASQAVRRAAAAFVAFDQWQAAGLAKRQQMERDLQRRTGQEVVEVGEGEAVADETAADAFGIEVGTVLPHVVLNALDSIRDTFTGLKAKLAKGGLTQAQASDRRTRQTTGNQTEVSAGREPWAINRHTFTDWFRSSVFATQRYCSRCSTASGNQQVKTAGGCPKCGAPTATLGFNSNTAHLPFISSAAEGAKVIGGWRLAFVRFRMGKRVFNTCLKACRGEVAIETALAAMMNQPVKVGVQVEGRTVMKNHDLRPVVFEVMALDGSASLTYGLALCPRHEDTDTATA